MERAANFNAGPGALPLPVLERISEELLDYRGTGMSVMEMSHRSPEFEEIIAAAGAESAEVAGDSGGVCGDFFAGRREHAVYDGADEFVLAGEAGGFDAYGDLDGEGARRIEEGRPAHVAASTEAEKFARLPRKDEIKYRRTLLTCISARTTRLRGRNRIRPETGSAPLVADMSSDIASRPIDVRKFGLIFAGAQKILGRAA